MSEIKQKSEQSEIVTDVQRKLRCAETYIKRLKHALDKKRITPWSYLKRLRKLKERESNLRELHKLLRAK